MDVPASPPAVAPAAKPFFIRHPSALFSFFAGAALLISALPVGTLPHLSVCWFKNSTGLPCPGCGLTRAFIAISHGDLPAAWHFNPFGFVFYALAVGLVAWPFLLWRFPRVEAWKPSGRRVTWFVLGMVAAMWVFGLCRILMGTDV